MGCGNEFFNEGLRLSVVLLGIGCFCNFDFKGVMFII